MCGAASCPGKERSSVSRRPRSQDSGGGCRESFRRSCSISGLGETLERSACIPSSRCAMRLSVATRRLAPKPDTRNPALCVCSALARCGCELDAPGGRGRVFSRRPSTTSTKSVCSRPRSRAVPMHDSDVRACCDQVRAMEGMTEVLLPPRCSSSAPPPSLLISSSPLSPNPLTPSCSAVAQPPPSASSQSPSFPPRLL